MPPLFRTTPLFYQPLLFYGKVLNPPFLRKFQKLNSPLCKKEGFQLFLSMYLNKLYDIWMYCSNKVENKELCIVLLLIPVFFGFFYGCSFFRLTYFTPIFSFCTRCFLMYPGGYRKETVVWNGRVTLIFFWDSLLLLKNVPPTYRSTSVLRKWANSY